ncbi:MAG: hypothetical protein H6712_09795 [Myxococcales bacterium]|nr:hypothetical protein [Myxococcales bacterium]MCB9714137.1 hypothetical protein [Myxococcales bacterium]
MASSSRSDRDRRRGGPPLGLLGLAALVALVAAYLGDCIPGLGAGSSVGTPSSETPRPADSEATPSDPAGAGKAELRIVVAGERCDAGAGLAPCTEVCAGLDASRAARSSIEIDAREGTHGAVEALRRCLEEAGFTTLHVRSE